MFGFDHLFVEVKVEGEIVSDLLINLQIEESDMKADMATLVFSDHDLILSDILHEGLTVEIDLGMKSAHTIIFRGIITNLKATFPTSGEPTVEVRAMDSLIKLGFKPKTKQWWNTPVMTIVQTIAIANGLIPGLIQPTADTLVTKARPLQQIEETDLAFLLRLAKNYDAKLSVAHFPVDTLHFVSTRTLTNMPPLPELLIFGVNLDDFTAFFDAFATQGNTQMVTTDPLTATRVAIPETAVLALEEKAAVLEAAWVPDPQRLLRLGPGAARIAKLIAKSAIKRSQLNDYWQAPSRVVGAASRMPMDLGRTFGDWSRRFGQTAQGKTQGNILLRPCTNILVKGCGGRWSGQWYLTEVNHQIDVRQKNYVCEFTCTR